MVSIQRTVYRELLNVLIRITTFLLRNIVLSPTYTNMMHALVTQVTTADVNNTVITTLEQRPVHSIVYTHCVMQQ